MQAPRSPPSPHGDGERGGNAPLGRRPRRHIQRRTKPCSQWPAKRHTRGRQPVGEQMGQISRTQRQCPWGHVPPSIDTGGNEQHQRQQRMRHAAMTEHAGNRQRYWGKPLSQQTLGMIDIGQQRADKRQWPRVNAGRPTGAVHQPCRADTENKMTSGLHEERKRGKTRRPSSTLALLGVDRDDSAFRTRDRPARRAAESTTDASGFLRRSPHDASSGTPPR
ncbi:hypothetical protein PPN31114_03136 [Pandoraea pneumonica]|uniref:Uncharacterized protein n=1 Tax=Pandoraea pneumonica TaxID=2508299 RepID=A0A5E4W8L2_9BURK|nr:hypothetical protein PPN31114_03136 [Pandoraea pneumonica]